ncbi:MAG: hypothetical protein ACYDAQ_01175 [Mycobacteriales bacterium]
MTTRARQPNSTDRVRQALAARPAASATALAEATGLGQSTVGKALAGLAAGGLARRTPGGRDAGRRLPDSWEAAPSVTPKPAGPATASDRSRTSAPARAAAGCSGAERLGRGGLRTLVLAHLRDHSPAEFSPTALATALGRSAGAISNAAETLVAASEVERCSDRPRRYRVLGGPAR